MVDYQWNSYNFHCTKFREMRNFIAQKIRNVQKICLLVLTQIKYIGRFVDIKNNLNTFATNCIKVYKDE